MERFPDPARLAVVAALSAATLLACGPAPRPTTAGTPSAVPASAPASVARTDSPVGSSPTGPPGSPAPTDSAATSSPATDSPASSPAAGGLPDGLSDISFAHVDHGGHSEGNRSGSIVTAGFLGSGPIITLEYEADEETIRVPVADRDVLAIQHLGAPRDEVELRQISTGEPIGRIPDASRVRLDAAHDRAYWFRSLGPGVGGEIHRSRLDGSDDTVLVELDGRLVPNAPPDGMNMYDFTVTPSGRFVAEVCTQADGCRVEIAAPDAARTTSIKVGGGPSLCSIAGALDDLIVVYDSETCYADDYQAPTPARTVDLATGETRLVNDGPYFNVVRLLEQDGAPQALIVRPSADRTHASLLAVDLDSGERTVLMDPLPRATVDGQPVPMSPSRLGLPPDWLLLVPEPPPDLPVGSPLPPAQLVNMVTNRWIELPALPGMNGVPEE